MSKLGITQIATVSTTKEIRLSPSLRRKLLIELKSYQAVKEQIKALEHAAEKHKGVISKLRDDTGEQSVALEGFTVTLVAPIRKVLNKQKLVALGCAAVWIEEATDSVPTKAYEKITLPGSKGDDDD